MHAELVGRDLSRRLHAAEAALDHALIEVATLAAALPEARMRAGVSGATGQAAFEDLAACLSALTQARGRLGGGHRTLAALARRMGLETLAAGPMDKPEDRPPMDGSNGVRNMVNQR
ncbi:MAG: hypothetical protein ACK4FB_04245 [Brevundimonas sp.]|uniref:hypothetical protein n=1 Tax=Brevundimonas sp. TaxID=1871086 RepID=UPI00391B164A